MERQSKLSPIPRVDSFTSHLGLVVMLGGMAMFFITLFVSQSILENRFGVSYMPG